MFKRIKLYNQFRKEINKATLRQEAVQWTKDHFRQRGIATWTGEYQYNFAIYVREYMEAHIDAYAKVRLNQEL